MARAHARYTLKDAVGNAVQNAKANVYAKGTTTPVTDLWSAESGGVLLTTLTSNAQGELEGWFDNPQSVDLQVTDNGAAAYYPGLPASPFPFTPFTETLDVFPVPTEIPRLGAEVDIRRYLTPGRVAGTTDDTAAMVAAVATGLNVYLPADTYVFGEVRLANPFQRIHGDGMGRTIVMTKAGALYALAWGGNTNTVPQFLEDLTIDGTNGGNYGLLIEDLGGIRSVGKNVEIRNVVGTAATWAATTTYKLGAVAVPLVGNGHVYRCITAGTTGGSAPAWPTTSGGTVTDGGVTWMEVADNLNQTAWGVANTDRSHSIVLENFWVHANRVGWYMVGRCQYGALRDCKSYNNTYGNGILGHDNWTTAEFNLDNVQLESDDPATTVTNLEVRRVRALTLTGYFESDGLAGSCDIRFRGTAPAQVHIPQMYAGGAAVATYSIIVETETHISFGPAVRLVGYAAAGVPIRDNSGGTAKIDYEHVVYGAGTAFGDSFSGKQVHDLAVLGTVSFFGATPSAQIADGTDLRSGLHTLGLWATGTAATPLDLKGGTLTAGIVSLSASQAASTGAVRLINNSTIKWRNAAGTGDISGPNVNASDILHSGSAMTMDGSLTMGEGHDLIIGTATGSKIGQAGSLMGFFGATPVAKPTGVAVTDAGIHAALVTLGLIAA